MRRDGRGTAFFLANRRSGPQDGLRSGPARRWRSPFHRRRASATRAIRSRFIVSMSSPNRALGAPVLLQTLGELRLGDQRDLADRFARAVDQAGDRFERRVTT